MAENVPVGQQNYKVSVIATENGSVVDLSEASVIKLWIEEPDGAVIFEEATLETDGTDGEMYYRIPLIDQRGWYNFRGYAEIGSFKGYTGKGSFFAEAL